MSVSKMCLVVLLLSALQGCQVMGHGSIFNREPFVDARKDANGNSVLLDTPRMWRDFVENVDEKIAEETDGAKPPGVDTWNRHWFLVIRHMRSGSQENPEKYVAYIVDSRRKKGLPELIGIP